MSELIVNKRLILLQRDEFLADGIRDVQGRCNIQHEQTAQIHQVIEGCLARQRQARCVNGGCWNGGWGGQVYVQNYLVYSHLCAAHHRG